MEGGGSRARGREKGREGFRNDGSATVQRRGGSMRQTWHLHSPLTPYPVSINASPLSVRVLVNAETPPPPYLRDYTRRASTLLFLQPKRSFGPPSSSSLSIPPKEEE